VVRERIETVGKGGGLLISPTHTLEPDVPWQNVIAFVEAVEEFGRY
jgi:uroporphyrinogen decarboxylase